jgi:ATP-binding cassette subfamily B protein
MHDLSAYVNRPLAFCFTYMRRRPVCHTIIFAAVAGAVMCSVSTQYGVKLLVDALSGPARNTAQVWSAFGILAALIAADNLLWRLACWTASATFVGVTGDLRRDLFRHVTGHAQDFFASKAPAALTSRVTAASNAMFTAENMLTCNVLPPCLAAAGAVMLLATVSVAMAAAMIAIGGGIVALLFVLADGGRPLHRSFADKAAAVDAEMADVVGNISLVRAFGGLQREHHRFDQTIEKEMSARRASLFYLERIRSIHALITIALAFGILCWAIVLWRGNAATTGDVILVCTLGLSVLHATRDLALALVDIIQHVARLSEALETLLVRHELRDLPAAQPLTRDTLPVQLGPRELRAAQALARDGANVRFEAVTFAYQGGLPIFNALDLHIEAGHRVALAGRSGGGKSTLFALLQRFYDVQGGRILLDGQDIKSVTQQSLREAIAVVPQDVSLFHRSILENIRYGRPEASDEEVWTAAVAARCSDFIEKLPAGYGTVTGDRGYKLSGGERQRIAIARAFLKSAPLLLLDEATSALDAESEEAIREALDRLMLRRTVIAIAHRLSTARSFDRILVLDHGAIVEDGSPEQLLTRQGPYRAFVQAGTHRLNQPLISAA